MNTNDLTKERSAASKGQHPSHLGQTTQPQPKHALTKQTGFYHPHYRQDQPLYWKIHTQKEQQH